MVPRATLLISTYEMPRHLELVCAGLERQSVTDVELMFCDDGSGPETARVIETFAARSRSIVRHMWQEDLGYRKTRILNRGLAESTAPLVIGLDGDCVPHRDYIRDHLALQEPGIYLAGRRVELGPTISETLTPDSVRAGFFDGPTLGLVMSGLRGDSKKIQRSVRVTSPLMRKMFKLDQVEDLLGCNWSAPRQALEAINGFDEAYEGYGCEDNDFEIRLQHLGLRRKSIKGLAVQFHVWHPRLTRVAENRERLSQVQQSTSVRCENGLVSSGQS